MRRAVLAALIAAALAAAAPAGAAQAESVRFDGLQFETPAEMTRHDGPPRPNGPFLRYRRGTDADAQYDVIEAMSTPLADVRGRFTPKTFAGYALAPATMYCGAHEILRNETRAIGDATIVDVGYLCLDHARAPELSRQIVRNIAVFQRERLTMVQFVRRWRAGPHPDDALTSADWIAPTDALAASIARCAEAC